jgi:hypothetical protein
VDRANRRLVLPSGGAFIVGADPNRMSIAGG